MTYARWGNPSYQYGNNTRFYGVGANDTILRWIIEIDWNGDGVFDGTNEARYAVGLTVKRGRSNYIRLDGDGKANGFDRMRIGRLSLTLKNRNGRYDPYNTSSPLYPYILPGRYIKVRLDYAGTIYPVFAGKIYNIRPISGTDPIVTIEAEDGGRILQNTDVSISVQQSVDLDDAIGQVLDDVNYPTLWGRSLEDSADTLNYWWADDRAITEIERLADADLGQFFVAADGAATFYNRHHTNTDLFSLTQAEILKEIEVPLPWEAVRNVVKVVAHPRVAVTSQTLWTLADTPPIGAGESLTVWASYTYSDKTVPAYNVVTPVATTDYLVNTAADGSGSNLTGSCTISTFTDFGTTAKIVLTNSSGSAGYVTLLKVRGDALTAPDASLQIAEDTASQAIYEKLLFTLDSDWLQDTELAGHFAEWLISFLATPQKFPTVQLEGRTVYQFQPDLFDTIGLAVSRLGINSSFRVAEIEHQWLVENGQAVRTTWRLEPYADLSDFWQFTTTIGVTSVFGI